MLVPTSQTKDYQTDSVDNDDLNNPFIVWPPLPMVHTAETHPLPLPSTFGYPHITTLGLDSLTKKELKLREGQVNDELWGVRMALSEKSFMFRKNVHLAQSKLKKGRAWSKVHGVSCRVQAHHDVYNAARVATLLLGCPAEMQTKYQVLHWDQLKISTVAVRGSTGTSSAEARSCWQDEPLAWFWTLNVQADIEASDMLKECMSTYFPPKGICTLPSSLQGPLAEGKCQAYKMVGGVIHYSSWNDLDSTLLSTQSWGMDSALGKHHFSRCCGIF